MSEVESSTRCRFLKEKLYADFWSATRGFGKDDAAITSRSFDLLLSTEKGVNVYWSTATTFLSVCTRSGSDASAVYSTSMLVFTEFCLDSRL